MAVPSSGHFRSAIFFKNDFKIVLKLSTACNISRLASQNECAGAEGSWIILLFMCDTGGLPVPCVYALLSLTWCNRTCGNNSGAMASQRESLKNAPFFCHGVAPYLNISGAWMGQSVPSRRHRHRISFSCPKPSRKPIAPVAMGIKHITL